jgi:hypothetical protein
MVINIVEAIYSNNQADDIAEWAGGCFLRVFFLKRWHLGLLT